MPVIPQLNLSFLTAPKKKRTRQMNRSMITPKLCYKVIESPSKKKESALDPNDSSFTASLTDEELNSLHGPPK